MNSLKYLTDIEFIALESRLMQYSESNTRDSLLFLLAIKTGARASELLGLRVCGFNPLAGTLLIHGLKGSLDRELPLSDSMAGLLVRYMRSLGLYTPETLLFNIGYKRLFQLWCHYKRGITDKKFHACRHGVAVALYKRSRNIHLVKYVLGHKSIDNTMIYLSYVETNDELRKVML